MTVSTSRRGRRSSRVANSSSLIYLALVYFSYAWGYLKVKKKKPKQKTMFDFFSHCIANSIMESFKIFTVKVSSEITK